VVRTGTSLSEGTMRLCCPIVVDCLEELYAASWPAAVAAELLAFRICFPQPEQSLESVEAAGLDASKGVPHLPQNSFCDYLRLAISTNQRKPPSHPVGQATREKPQFSQKRVSGECRPRTEGTSLLCLVTAQAVGENSPTTTGRLRGNCNHCNHAKRLDRSTRTFSITLVLNMNP